jgi:hypothetical protein
MKRKTIRRTLALVAAFSALALGCELIVDFDRTKIPIEGTDATPTVDGQGPVDTGVDTGADAAKEAGDAGDGGADAADTGADAPDGD